MTQWHHKSKRKASGGIRTSLRGSDKKLAWKGNEPTLTSIALKEDGKKVVLAKAYGGNSKPRVVRAHTANVSGEKKTIKGKILSVVENKANRLYTRKNIVTKGAIVKVLIESGEKLAKVTSRPGQTGSVNAVLLEDKKMA